MTPSDLRIEMPLKSTNPTEYEQTKGIPSYTKLHQDHVDQIWFKDILPKHC